MIALFAIIVANFGETYFYNGYWRQKEKYYYESMTSKINEITLVSSNCTTSYLNIEDLTTFNNENVNESVIKFYYAVNIDKNLFNWWSSITKPIQMRVDPLLCKAVYLKKKAIFNQTGCQLSSYMHPSAPRCQNAYLKWICENAQMSIDELKPNHFILPEADHNTTNIPPKPWLIRVTNSYVSMCGQIYSRCGLIHTTANCMATGYQSQALLFRKKCDISLMERTLLDTSPPQLDGTHIVCDRGAPFDTKVYFHEKVFIVAEVDDTYVYHIHLEIIPRIILHLDYLLTNSDIKILYGCDTMKTAQLTEGGLKQGMAAMSTFMSLIGLSMDRLIVHKHVFAKE
eukprot:gene10064-13524_t